MVNLFAMALAVISTLISSFGIILFKMSSKFKMKEMLFKKPFIIGGSLFIPGGALLIIAMKLEDLSLIFPITSLTYIWIMVLSKIYLKEKLNKWKIMSVGFIVIGIVFVTAFR
jgi:drug/metabolite transporter (DMT)-like permease